MELQGKRGAGRFQWNLGGWLGGQVGGTLWLVLLGALLWAQGQREGLWIVTLGLAANAFGCLLWSRRDAIAPYPAMQLLLALCGLAAGLSMWVLASAGISAADVELPSLSVIAIYPALMIWFHVLESRARGRSPETSS